MEAQRVSELCTRLISTSSTMWCVFWCGWSDACAVCARSVVCAVCLSLPLPTSLSVTPLPGVHAWGCVSLSLTDFPMLSELYNVTRMSSCANMLERRTLTSEGSVASNLGTMLDAQAKRVETFDHTSPYATLTHASRCAGGPKPQEPTTPPRAGSCRPR